MDLSYEFLRGLTILGLFIFGGTWFIIRWIKKSSDEPGVLITKWVISGIMLFICGGIAFSGSPIAPLLVMIPCLFLAITWAPNIGNLVAKPLTSMFDGGDEEPDAKPFLSIANAHRMKSQFPEAIEELRNQLDKFPTDYQVQIMIATIQAEDLQDVGGAEETINHLLTQKQHPGPQIASALNMLADWHLKFNRDSYSARQAFEKIRDLYPNTEQATLAAQRLSSLGTGYVAPSLGDRQPIALPQSQGDMGLNAEPMMAPEEESPVTLANQYVGHLRQHPDDWDTREKLALIYASHYQRLDLAVAELEHLIAAPNQPVRSVVRWLNLMADLQLKHTEDNKAARQTLQRIAARYPGSAHASQALEQIVRLTEESKKKNPSQGLPLGSYEKDIGLNS
jgi:tetratricopeptide (TPR) repeat protein